MPCPNNMCLKQFQHPKAIAVTIDNWKRATFDRLRHQKNATKLHKHGKRTSSLNYSTIRCWVSLRPYPRLLSNTTPSSSRRDRSILSEQIWLFFCRGFGHIHYFWESCFFSQPLGNQKTSRHLQILIGIYWMKAIKAYQNFSSTMCNTYKC